MNVIHLLNDIDFIYLIIIRVFCIGIALSSLEYLYSINEYSVSGIFSWKVFRLTPKILNSRWFDQFDFIFGKNGVAFLVAARLISAITLLILPITDITVYLIAIIALTSLIMFFRNVVGNDGSDQMNSIICVTLFITFFFKDSKIAKLGLFFICGQVILSYVVAGIAKGVSKKWRSGMAIYEIMNTKTYGDKRVAHLLKKLPKSFTIFLNWNIIIFECLFFLVILLPFPFFLVFIIWGVLFHFNNAVLMGLNGFFWAFLASYPAILYVNFYIHY